MEGTPFGRYRLVDLLGRGGMGEVWKAYDTAMNRVVALKVLPANFADDEQYQVRFRREAQAAAGLDEPHVVPIHDFGEIDGRLYVTMRLIDGKTVNELLVDGPLAPARAVWIVEQIAAALNAAHRVGLIHRDVKPSNILVTEDDFAYLIDFGIARVAGATKLTSTGATIGTLAYMAPERFTSDRADARADIYALTCVLYECLTGVPAVSGRQSGTSDHQPSHTAAAAAVDGAARGVATDGPGHRDRHGQEPRPTLRLDQRSGGCRPRRPRRADRAPVSPPTAFNWAPSAPSWSRPPRIRILAERAVGSRIDPTPHACRTRAVASDPDADARRQPAQTGRPWWRGPAILIPAALVAVDRRRRRRPRRYLARRQFGTPDDREPPSEQDRPSALERKSVRTVH